MALRPNWSRTVGARRLAAAALVLLAAVAAIRPDPAGERAEAVVASRDLQPGVTLTAADVHVEQRPATALPAGVRQRLDDVVGSTVAGPARRGEVLTDVRLLGPRLAEAAVGRDARIVPLRLADSALLDVLHTGDVVDVLAARDAAPGAGHGGEDGARLVATGAIVVLISPEPTQRGVGDQRVVLVALPLAQAHTVAGIALVETVTLVFH